MRHFCSTYGFNYCSFWSLIQKNTLMNWTEVEKSALSFRIEVFQSKHAFKNLLCLKV